MKNTATYVIGSVLLLSAICSMMYALACHLSSMKWPEYGDRDAAWAAQEDAQA